MNPGSGPSTVIGIAWRVRCTDSRKIDIAECCPWKSILVHDVGEQVVPAAPERPEADGELASASFRMQVPHSIQIRHTHQKEVR